MPLNEVLRLYAFFKNRKFCPLQRAPSAAGKDIAFGISNFILKFNKVYVAGRCRFVEAKFLLTCQGFHCFFQGFDVFYVKGGHIFEGFLDKARQHLAWPQLHVIQISGRL